MAGKMKGTDVWPTIRSMIDTDLERFGSRYPKSKRVAILKKLKKVAVAENVARLLSLGEEYFQLTSQVPPGCYAYCASRVEKYFFNGTKVTGSRRGESWTIHLYSPQAWR